MSAGIERCRVVVIGGGAVGASVLYHLALRGFTDAVLLDRDELTSGSTWHAAGNCPNFSTSQSVMALQAYSTRLYAELGECVGYPLNYPGTGSLRLAHSRERLDEFHRVAAMARRAGIAFEVVSPQEARVRHPFLELHDLVGALWDPGDGDIDPSQLTQAFAKGARDLGVRIHRFTRVTGLSREAGGEWRVTTDKGAFACDIVVNAAGYRAAEVMALVGRPLPLVTMSHQYLVTELIDELAGYRTLLPILRDPDVSYYLRQERQGLLLGPYEADARLMWRDGIPDNFANQLWPDDLDRLETYLEDAMARVPILASVGIQRVINGPIPYTPDGNPLIGPVRGAPGLFLCCGFSFGIAQAGGAGRVAADWIVDGAPSWDIWNCEALRFGDYATVGYTAERACELYRREYAIAFPVDEWSGGRPALQTPLYGVLASKGAQFCARGGWERAAWFARAGDDPEPPTSFRRSGWHDAVGEECRAVREAVGIMDMGGFTKMRIEGEGAARFLDRLLCGRLPPVGRVRLTWALDHKGRIVSEFTVSRLADDVFYLVSAASAHEHDLALIEAALPVNGSVRMTDLSGALGSVVIAGPRARDLLTRVTDAPLDNAAFPWLSAKEIELGFGRALALRVGYVGELGFELHMPLAALTAAYTRLCAAGADLGLRDFGVYAMDSLRMEKSYRGWKTDIDRNVTPLEAGFRGMVALDKGDFTGRAALAGEDVKRSMVTLMRDDAGDAEAPPMAVVWRDGRRVGDVTSAAYGHALGKSLALALVERSAAAPGTPFEIEMFGRMESARVVAESPYDPTNARLRM
ncbi:MAG: FAD-dependent oxidoreductase [Pseudolabrys sp.]|nr:FAD-dependent oxidoreductase [Pseudolabrys sp.]